MPGESAMGGMPKASVWDTGGRRRVPRTEGKETGREGVLRWTGKIETGGDRRVAPWTQGNRAKEVVRNVILVYKRAPRCWNALPPLINSWPVFDSYLNFVHAVV